MEAQFNRIKSELEANMPKYARHIYGGFNARLCPHLQFIRIDALEKEDFPHNISDNSIYIEFEIDLQAHKIELFRTGHIYLSAEDKRTDRYKYLCMKSMTDCFGKKFRKQGYKSEADAAKKMRAYFEAVMEAVNEYTGGYPYEQGK